jgi:hypothetical protein
MNSGGTLARSYASRGARAGHLRFNRRALHLAPPKPSPGLPAQVMPNERWALLGGNGAGKSTLLRAVAAAARGDDYADAEIAVDPRLRLGMLEQVGAGQPWLGRAGSSGYWQAGPAGPCGVCGGQRVRGGGGVEPVHKRGKGAGEGNLWEGSLARG